jgi:hypothetical protein
VPTGRNADLDESDAGIGIVVLRSRTHDDDGLAGFDDRKTFPDRCYDWPSRDRPSRRGVVRDAGCVTGKHEAQTTSVS